MIQFMTYNQALMWSRFERIFFVSMSLLLIVFCEYVVSDQPTYMMSLAAGLVAQLLVLKCWLDMIFLSKPGLNCWAFKE